MEVLLRTILELILLSESTELGYEWADTYPSIAVDQDNEIKSSVGSKVCLENGSCQKKVLFE